MTTATARDPYADDSPNVLSPFGIRESTIRQNADGSVDLGVEPEKSEAPSRKKQDTSEWVATRIRGNSTGVYWSLNTAPRVTVKHSTRFDSVVCLTCLVGDGGKPTKFNSCAHTRFMRTLLTDAAA